MKKEEILNLINLTPHDINIVRNGEELVTFPKSNQIARCKEAVEQVGYITVNGVKIPIIRKRLGEIEGLPEPQEGVKYLVSLAVAKAAVGRNDLLVPGQAVRDEKGRIIGTSALAVV